MRYKKHIQKKNKLEFIKIKSFSQKIFKNKRQAIGLEKCLFYIMRIFI